MTGDGTPTVGIKRTLSPASSRSSSRRWRSWAFEPFMLPQIFEYLGPIRRTYFLGQPLDSVPDLDVNNHLLRVEATFSF